jgi:hypothetical protein
LATRSAERALKAWPASSPLLAAIAWKRRGLRGLADAGRFEVGVERFGGEHMDRHAAVLAALSRRTIAATRAKL